MKRFLKKVVQFLPSLGCFLFVILFLFSATQYPGGSQADVHSLGFDWVHNYWCNLLSKKAMNGMVNTSRPIAISAMVIICFGIAVFFVQFVQVLVTSMFWKRVIVSCGIMSMITAVLMSTKYHDEMTIVSSFFGLFAIFGVIKTIYQSELKAFKILGVLCLILLFVNNLVYYSEYYLKWLPLIQKFTIVMVLTWIIGLNIALSKQQTQNQVHKN